VPPGSRAAEAGLRPGDLIQEIDKTRVHSPDDLKKALAKDGKQTHLLLVFREGMTHYVAVPPASE
jgi:serine protease Do